MRSRKLQPKPRSTRKTAAIFLGTCAVWLLIIAWCTAPDSSGGPTIEMTIPRPKPRPRPYPSINPPLAEMAQTTVEMTIPRPKPRPRPYPSINPPLAEMAQTTVEMYQKGEGKAGVRTFYVTQDGVEYFCIAAAEPRGLWCDGRKSK